MLYLTVITFDLITGSFKLIIMPFHLIIITFDLIILMFYLIIMHLHLIIKTKIGFFSLNQGVFLSRFPFNHQCPVPKAPCASTAPLRDRAPLTVNAHGSASLSSCWCLAVAVWVQTWLLSAKYRTAATRSAIRGARRACSLPWM